MTTTAKFMTPAEAARVAADHERLAGLIEVPFGDWAHQCHSVSLKLLRTGKFGPGRIARGWMPGVSGQHSLIVLGSSVYDRDATLVDPTLWSYVDDVNGILVTRARHSPFRPHGAGSVWKAGRPLPGDEDPVRLTPSSGLSAAARHFIEALGPLDRRGWATLVHGPMEEWPAGEIIAAIDDTEELKALVPIDILGMVTRRNPGEMYW